MRRSLLASLLAGLCVTLGLRAAEPLFPLPLIEPTRAGFSTDRLEKMHRSLRELVDRGSYAGYVTLLARDGKIVDWRAVGYRDLAGRLPMEKDSIVRIYSLSKLVASVAVLQLIEDGRLNLDDPVEQFLPALGSPKVLVGGTADAPQLIPAKRSVTIRHLLTHTAGYGFDGGDSVLAELYRKANIWEANSLEDYVARVAAIPLHHQPGEAFCYGVSTELLGAVIERIAGERLEKRMQREIFGPLGMNDTGFDVPPEKLPRLAKIYRHGPDGALVESAVRYGAYTEEGRGFAGAGSGLFSTAGDYARFAEMLLEGGQLGGVRVLGRKSVELMTQDHLRGQGIAHHTYSDSRGFGFGMEVMIDVTKSSTLGSVGQYGWYGAATTYCQIDPKERLVALAFLQHLPQDEHDFYRKFANGYCAALTP